MNNAKQIPSDRWFAMTRLDENRAKTQLALKSNSHWRHVSNMAIWGNHSIHSIPISSMPASMANRLRK